MTIDDRQAPGRCHTGLHHMDEWGSTCDGCEERFCEDCFCDGRAPVPPDPHEMVAADVAARRDHVGQ